MFLKFKKNLSLLFCSFVLISCASYKSKVFEAQKMLKNGQFSEALEKLKTLSEIEDRDQLLYLLDYATALQIAGKYKESTQIFQKADKLVDMNDYHSVSNVASATLGGEEMVQYKGESYEKFLINTMNAINYLMMGQNDGALVEARRINEKILKLKMDGRDPYEQSSFARYLAALVWESDRKFDDAYLEYEGAYKLDGRNIFLPGDLLRTSKLARRDETYREWKKEFPSVSENSAWYDRNLGEVVIILQQGWGAQKQNRPGSYRFPMLRPQVNETLSTRVHIAGMDSIESKTVYDVDQVAISTLEKDFGALVARRVGGIAAKAIVSDQIRQKNQLLGDLTWIAMNLADRADLRQWSTLPASIQMVRVYLKPGSYRISAQGLDIAGGPTGDTMQEQEVKVTAGRKVFLNWRTLR